MAPSIEGPPVAPVYARRAWLRGASWLVVGNAGSIAASAVVALALARELGPRTFGLYSAITVASALAATLVTFRLDMHLVTVLGEPETDRANYRTALSASYVLCLPTCAIALGVLWFVSPPDVRSIGTLALIEVALSPLALRRAVLQVQMRQRGIVAASLVNRAIWLTAAIGVVWLARDPLPWLFVARSLAVAGEAGVLMSLSPLAAPSSVDAAPDASVRAALRVLWASVPLAVAGFAGMAYDRIDQLILVGYRGRGQNGVYAAGVRIAELLGVVAPIVQNVSLPGLVHLARKGDDAGFDHAVRDSVVFMLAPAGLAVAVLIAKGDVIATILFGSAYASAGRIVQVLSAAEWTTLAATTFSSAALALGQRRLLVRANAIGLVVNVVLNVMFVPRYGAEAAAWASLAGYGVAAVGMAFGSPELRRAAGTSLPTTVRLACPVLAGAAVASLLEHDVWSIAAGSVTYCAVLAVAMPRDLQRALAGVRSWLQRRSRPIT